MNTEITLRIQKVKTETERICGNDENNEKLISFDDDNVNFTGLQLTGRVNGIAMAQEILNSTYGELNKIRDQIGSTKEVYTELSNTLITIMCILIYSKVLSFAHTPFLYDIPDSEKENILSQLDRGVSITKVMSRHYKSIETVQLINQTIFEITAIKTMLTRPHIIDEEGTIFPL